MLTESQESASFIAVCLARFIDLGSTWEHGTIARKRLVDARKALTTVGRVSCKNGCY